MLGRSEPLHRLESYDISHIAGTDIVASMVVFCDGAPSKKDYKRFKLEDMPDQDDYASMRQVLTRRLRHFAAGDAGFSEKPNALLIDGGVEHAKIAEEVVREFALDIPVYGMVKDDRHRTRALVTADGHEIGISGNQAVFALIGRIQEETHRFAIEYHRQLRSKRLRESSLEKIPGVGPKRREQLLKKFRSVSAVQKAELAALREVLPEAAAQAVYSYFHQEDTQCESSQERPEA